MRLIRLLLFFLCLVNTITANSFLSEVKKAYFVEYKKEDFLKYEIDTNKLFSLSGIKEIPNVTAWYMTTYQGHYLRNGKWNYLSVSRPKGGRDYCIILNLGKKRFGIPRQHSEEVQKLLFSNPKPIFGNKNDKK